MVYNPDENVKDIALVGGIRTLQEVMDAPHQLWKYFGSVRSVTPR